MAPVLVLGLTVPDYPQAALDAAALALHRTGCPGDGVDGCLHDNTCDGKPFTFETDAARAALDAAAPLLAAELRQKIHNQARQIRDMQVVAERKNRELDALHLVWCDGACPSGVHRWSDLLVTEELVAMAERNTKRLRRWYGGVKFQLGLQSPTADKWLEHYARRAAAKTDLACPAPEGESNA